MKLTLSAVVLVIIIAVLGVVPAFGQGLENYKGYCYYTSKADPSFGYWYNAYKLGGDGERVKRALEKMQQTARFLEDWLQLYDLRTEIDDKFCIKKMYWAASAFEEFDQIFIRTKRGSVERVEVAGRMRNVAGYHLLRLQGQVKRGELSREEYLEKEKYFSERMRCVNSHFV